MGFLREKEEQRRSASLTALLLPLQRIIFRPHLSSSYKSQQTQELDFFKSFKTYKRRPKDISEIIFRVRMISANIKTILQDFLNINNSKDIKKKRFIVKVSSQT